MVTVVTPLEELIVYKADRYAERDAVDLRRLLAEWAGKIDVGCLREVAKRGDSLEKLVIAERKVELRELILQ